MSHFKTDNNIQIIEEGIRCSILAYIYRSYFYFY